MSKNVARRFVVTLAVSVQMDVDARDMTEATDMAESLLATAMDVDTLGSWSIRVEGAEECD